MKFVLKAILATIIIFGLDWVFLKLLWAFVDFMLWLEPILWEKFL